MTKSLCFGIWLVMAGSCSVWNLLLKGTVYFSLFPELLSFRVVHGYSIFLSEFRLLRCRVNGVFRKTGFEFWSVLHPSCLSQSSWWKEEMSVAADDNWQRARQLCFCCSCGWLFSSLGKVSVMNWKIQWWELLFSGLLVTWVQHRSVEEHGKV